MFRKIWKIIGIGFIALTVISGAASCSSSPTECGVTYDAKEDSFEIIINPPGETGEFRHRNLDDEMKVTRKMSFEAGKSTMNISEYEINQERVYEDSGNKYLIVGSVIIDDTGKRSKLTGYSLSVTGGVYGDMAHTCME